MAERYSRLYSLPEDLYTPGAPLVIAAGALLRDNQTGQVLAQLKMRSICDRIITAVKVLVIGYGVDKEELCREEHQYLDMKVARDKMFGSKEAVLLRERAVRSFTARITAVYFDDGSCYECGDGAWEPLPEQKELLSKLFDAELIHQYRLETTERSRFVPLEIKDLWLCTCGEINRAGEGCHRCGQALEDVKALLDVNLLKENKSLRLKAEAEKSRRDEQRRQSRSHRLKRALLILVPLLLVAAALYTAYTLSSRKLARYENAVALYEAGSYSEAVNAFNKLGDYRDSAEYLAKAKAADAQISDYTRAGKLLENGRYDDARELYLALGDYEDSARLAQEALYRKAKELLDSGSLTEARDLFLSLGDYEDSAELASHFHERLLTEELSYHDDCKGPLTTVYTYDARGRVAETTALFSAYDNMENRVSTYTWNEDGSYSITENHVEKLYDSNGSYLGQGEHIVKEYDYGYYNDGTLQYCVAYEDGLYLSETKYDRFGNQESFSAVDGANITYKNEYADGRLIKTESYAPDGTLIDRTTFEYDEQGRIKRQSFLIPGADAAITTVYTYGLVYLPEAES